MMKKYSTPLFLAMFASVFLSAQNANAFLPLPTIDFSVITQAVKNVIDQVKSSTAVVTTTQTVSKISSSIGDAVATVSSFVNEGKDKLKELEKVKKQAEDYKKEYDTYKKYTDNKIEQAKSAKENAERLKALTEDPSSMVGSVESKLTSTAKSYGGNVGVPTSKEEFEEKRDGIAPGGNNKTDLTKDAAVTNKNEDKLQKNAGNVDKDKKDVSEEDENADDELTEEELEEGLENLKENPAIYDAIKSDKKATFRQGALPLLEGKIAGQASKKAEKAANDLKGALKQTKDGVKVSPKTTVKGADLKAKSSLPGAKESGASVKGAKEAKPAVQNIKNEQNLLKKAPDSGFRKGAKMKTSSLNVFGKKKYDLSFAAAANDHQNSNTGKSTSGDAILPRNIASFCEISVSDLKSDFEKMNHCLAKINKDHDGTDTSDYQITTEDFKNMRMQNASDALAIALKMENVGAHQEDVLKELDERAKNLRDNRQTTSIAPYYDMEIAKAIKNYTFVRATRIAYDVFDNMKSLDLRKWEE